MHELVVRHLAVGAGVVADPADHKGHGTVCELVVGDDGLHLKVNLGWQRR